METLQAIYSRRSVRQFSGKPVEQEKTDKILKAAMSGPCCVNAREWEFIVVTDKSVLNKMADANGKPAQPLRSAPMAVLVCGNLQNSFKPAPDYWVIDCSIAIQNMSLAAHDMGLGSVWLGTWPQADRVKNQAKLFNLPDYIIPHSVIAFGYPLNDSATERDLYDSSKVHCERW
ncbi:MAG: nitroreductase family protein [Clostridia bacterium]|nr:nitroreductase family protein [Clostridia bacterium]